MVPLNNVTGLISRLTIAKDCLCWGREAIETVG